jgi:putative flippase GtrA
MPSHRKLTILALYVLFCAISGLTNIVVQWSVLLFGHGFLWDYASIAIGTLVGLVIKYQLDKHSIFRFLPNNLQHDAKTFFVYAFFGVFTTALFWATELAFRYFSANRDARYLGAAIGLAIGYVIKYQMDKRLTFSFNK